MTTFCQLYRVLLRKSRYFSKPEHFVKKLPLKKNATFCSFFPLVHDFLYSLPTHIEVAVNISSTPKLFFQVFFNSFLRKVKGPPRAFEIEFIPVLRGLIFGIFTGSRNHVYGEKHTYHFKTVNFHHCSCLLKYETHIKTIGADNTVLSRD